MKAQALCRLHLLASCLSIAACGVKVHTQPPVDPGQGPVPPAPAPSPGGEAGRSGAAGSPGTAGSTTAPPAPGAPGAGGSGGTPASAGPVGPDGSGAGGAAPADAPITTDTTADGSPVPDARPPASTVGVTIGGRFVPREKAVVFLHIGHSDMAGRATGPAALRPFMFDPHPQLWIYQRGGRFVQAREPNTAGDDASAGKSGPGMAILRTALERAPDAYMISIGHGHSGSTIGFCPNFRKGRPLYREYMDEALELKGKVTFGALFTMFGITEYHTGSQGLATTGDCILGIINEVRADLGEPELPLMVGDWNEGGEGMYSPGGAEGRVVRPQLRMLPQRDPRTALIPTAGLSMEDDRHLNMAGQKLWAERAFMIMGERGFLPWAPP
jgi:hypothetical protein